jgi:hypothetical protein
MFVVGVKQTHARTLSVIKAAIMELHSDFRPWAYQTKDVCRARVQAQAQAQACTISVGNTCYSSFEAVSKRAKINLLQ